MSDNILPDEITKLMKSPEIAAILASIGGENAAKSPPEAPPEEGFSLPPDFSEKLPAIMAALSAMGNGKESRETATAPLMAMRGESASPVGAQRKALLRALRPYLNGKRQKVIDSLIALDGISGLLSEIPGGTKGGT